MESIVSMTMEGYVEDWIGNSIRPLAAANATLKKFDIQIRKSFEEFLPISARINIIEWTFSKTAGIENSTQRKNISFRS
jgi:hypothetical protein